MSETVEPLKDAEIVKLWRECGGKTQDYFGNPRSPEAYDEAYIIPDHGFMRFVSLLETRITNIARETDGRLAFKAGWRTNATTDQSQEYLDGCERVDWEEYRARGLSAYLDGLKPDSKATA
ncbi:hypothetical protein [Mesorhizobium sp. M4B.F.Ca.ET.143.01.1.1]|uniref:hypothetical protein n=1 Tax=Mesorhizobium sp. M4B.F.Ca.ET.143.01.1.1 TaxID=2563947 RepID=UPI001093EC22|nr:hypothetical protein [Mesorhizobium sp. M4B.F.Ca.ET.143.01.1.1]TGV26359.1 hypothetical protein EN786_12620 [Mesorhizobium sp. M4B.F.Ca.ET.143.01.1.1]